MAKTVAIMVSLMVNMVYFILNMQALWLHVLCVNMNVAVSTVYECTMIVSHWIKASAK